MEAEEVELIDYLRVIWKRKGLIVGGTLLAAATALVVSLSMPKTYEVSRTLKIGMLPGGIIESRDAVMGRLRDQRVLADLIKELRLDLSPTEMAGLVSNDSKINPHIRYMVQATDPQLATRIADWLAENIIAIHKGVFERGTRITKQHEQNLGVVIGDIKGDIHGMKGALATIMKAPETNVAAILLLQANIKDRERHLANLYRELKEAHFLLLRSKNTSVIAADAPPQHPVRPKVMLNVELAGVLGLMIFTFLAFVLEYIEKAKRREG